MYKATPEPMILVDDHAQLSPKRTEWAKLTARDVDTLTTREGLNMYFYLDHPIKRVRLVGVIVSFKDNDYYVCFGLDDGSGRLITLDYPKYKSDRPDSRTSGGTSPLDLNESCIGSVIKAKGEISTRHCRRQITLETLEVLPDTNAEVTAWKTAGDFKRDILLKPWQDEKLMLKGRQFLQTQSEEVFRGKRRDKRLAHEGTQINQLQQVSARSDGAIMPLLLRSERPNQGRGMDSSSLIHKGTKSETVDTFRDRNRIQEAVLKWEALEIAAAIAGTKPVYPKHEHPRLRMKEDKIQIQERPEDEEFSEGRFASAVESFRYLDRHKSPGCKWSLSSTSGFRRPSSHKSQIRKYRIIKPVRPETVTPLSPPIPTAFPPPPPDSAIYTSRNLKHVILTKIITGGMNNFTLSNLRVIPEIESYTTAVALSQRSPSNSKTILTSALIFETYCDVLSTLVDDGNIIRVPSPSSYHTYISVGRWNLEDLVMEAAVVAKAKATRMREREEVLEVGQRGVYVAGKTASTTVAVRSIWKKAQAQGGGWEGVTKGVVAEVVKEVLEDQEGWLEISHGIWEWGANRGRYLSCS